MPPPRRRYGDDAGTEDAVSAEVKLAVALVAATALAPAPAEAHPKRRAGLREVCNANSDSLGMPPTRCWVGEQTDSARAHLDLSPGLRGSCTRRARPPRGPRGDGGALAGPLPLGDRATRHTTLNSAPHHPNRNA